MRIPCRGRIKDALYVVTKWSLRWYLTFNVAKCRAIDIVFWKSEISHVAMPGHEAFHHHEISPEAAAHGLRHHK